MTEKPDFKSALDDFLMFVHMIQNYPPEGYVPNDFMHKATAQAIEQSLRQSLAIEQGEMVAIPKIDAKKFSLESAISGIPVKIVALDCGEIIASMYDQMKAAEGEQHE